MDEQNNNGRQTRPFGWELHSYDNATTPAAAAVSLISNDDLFPQSILKASVIVSITLSRWSWYIPQRRERGGCQHHKKIKKTPLFVLGKGGVILSRCDGGIVVLCNEERVSVSASIHQNTHQFASCRFRKRRRYFFTLSACIIIVLHKEEKRGCQHRSIVKSGSSRRRTHTYTICGSIPPPFQRRSMKKSNRSPFSIDAAPPINTRR